MKILFFILILQFTFADHIYQNNDGFPICYEKNNKVYFFDWDHFSHVQEKQISYFEINDYVKETGHLIKNCSDQKYIHDVPLSILKPVKTSLELSDQVQFLLNQIAHGATVSRIEKTTAEFITNNKDLFKIDSRTQVDSLRKKYGDLFTTEVISAWSQHVFSTAKNCQEYIGTCDFYLCQEQKNPCGLDGYNLGFGFKYCSGSRFELMPQMESELGHQWVSDVFQCLQKRSLFISQIQELNSCEHIRSDAYDSHPDCYVKAGFCQLDISEKLKIFQLIKKEIFSTGTLKQAQDLLQKCYLPTRQQEILNQQLIGEYL